jgi:hypothetical protein
MSSNPVSGLSDDTSGSNAEVLDAAELNDVAGGFFSTPVTWDPEPSPWLPSPFLPSALS